MNTPSDTEVHAEHQLRVDRRTWTVEKIVSVQFSSVTQSCPTLCHPMNCSTPGLPVHHQLPEFTETHVHRVSDAIQPSHPLSSPYPPASNLKGCCWITRRHQDSWPLEEKNSIRGQRRGLITQSFCVIKFYYSIKEIEKASDIGIRRGQKEYLLASINNEVI